MPDDMLPVAVPVAEVVADNPPAIEAQYTFADPGTYALNVPLNSAFYGGNSVPYIAFSNTGYTATSIDFATTSGGDNTVFGVFGCGTGIYTAATTSNISFNTASTGTITYTGGNSILYGVPLTAEQHEAMIAQQAAWAVEVAAQQRKHKRAEAKATQLLRSTVGKRQYALFKKRGHFEIVGQTGKRYRFRPHCRVQIMAENFGDRVDYELCIVHAEQYVPPTDTLITLMLLVLSGEAGEKVMHEKGNRRAA